MYMCVLTCCPKIHVEAIGEHLCSFVFTCIAGNCVGTLTSTNVYTRLPMCHPKPRLNNTDKHMCVHMCAPKTLVDT